MPYAIAMLSSKIQSPRWEIYSNTQEHNNDDNNNNNDNNIIIIIKFAYSFQMGIWNLNEAFVVFSGNTVLPPWAYSFLGYGYSFGVCIKELFNILLVLQLISTVAL